MSKERMSLMKKNKYILCIAGSRDLTDYDLIEKSMQMHAIQIEDIKEIISGGAKGVDSNAEKFAKFHKIKFKEYPADWKNLKHKDAIITNGQYGKYDKRAGFRRNELMAEKADKLLAITNGSSGTEHMIECMKKLNKEVFVYKVDPPEKKQGVEGKDYFTF